MLDVVDGHLSIPQSIVFERNGGRTFQPTTRAIGNQFDQFDPVFVHGGHPPIALPEVCPRTHAISHFVRRQYQGHDARTPADLAAAIEQVLADPERYRQASAAAAKELTWEAEAARLLRLYSTVLGDRGPGRG